MMLQTSAVMTPNDLLYITLAEQSTLFKQSSVIVDVCEDHNISE